MARTIYLLLELSEYFADFQNTRFSGCFTICLLFLLRYVTIRSFVLSSTFILQKGQSRKDAQGNNPQHRGDREDHSSQRPKPIRY